MDAEAKAGAEVIRVINYLRANLIKKEIEDTVLRILDPPLTFHHDREKLGMEMKLGRVRRMLRQMERRRARTWAPWKDFR